MTRHRWSSGLLALVVAAGTGCARREAGAPAPSRQAAPAAPQAAGGGERAAGLADGRPADEQKPGGLAAMAAARKLVRTGQMTVEVPAFGEAAQKLARLAEALGGYVAETRSRRDDNGRESGTLVLRVPAERFDELMTGTGGLGRVRARGVNAQDVTKAYTDLETRLRVKRETAERLREILKNRTAGLADVLAAERELARVTEEIEQAEGERRYYDQQVALSTLTVELAEPQALVSGGAWEPVREALHDALEVVGRSFAVMIYAFAFLAPWGLVLWVLWRIVKAWRGRRRKSA